VGGVGGGGLPGVGGGGGGAVGRRRGRKEEKPASVMRKKNHAEGRGRVIPYRVTGCAIGVSMLKCWLM
jgi:hypothetical protein